MPNVTVHLPGELRSHIGAESPTLEASGDNVREVLTALAQANPKLGQRLFKEGGQLNRYVNIFIDDEDIRFLDELETPIAAGQELSIVPAIAGG